MSRPLRLEFEGAVYHVTSRGNERSAIFRDDRDRDRFLSILGRVVGDQFWRLHAYCVMGNHYHLLLETPRGNLSSGMQRLNGRYTQWFNFRHRRSGHLFQGRYKAILVERDPHLLELCRYVVLNPVRAGIVESAGGWPWSNYRATCGRRAAPDWLEVGWTLSQFGRNQTAAREVYRQFVSDGRGLPSPFKEIRNQVYLGGAEFLRGIDLKLKGSRWDADIPREQRAPNPPSIDRIRKAVAQEFGVDEAALSRRRGGEAKMAAIYLSRRLSGKKGFEIADAFGVKPARVSNVVSEIEVGRNKSFSRLVRRLETDLRETR